MSLLLKLEAVTAGNCVRKQKPVITFSPSILGIWGTFLVFHFYPRSCPIHLPAAIFASSLSKVEKVHNCCLLPQKEGENNREIRHVISFYFLFLTGFNWLRWQALTLNFNICTSSWSVGGKLHWRAGLEKVIDSAYVQRLLWIKQSGDGDDCKSSLNSGLENIKVTSATSIHQCRGRQWSWDCPHIFIISSATDTEVPDFRLTVDGNTNISERTVLLRASFHWQKSYFVQANSCETMLLCHRCHSQSTDGQISERVAGRGSERGEYS